MLRKFSIAIALTAVLAACSKGSDDTGPDNDGPALTFTYANPLGATYSGTVKASAAEKVIRDMDVFMFLADGTFVCRLTEATDYTSENNGEMTRITLLPSLLEPYSGQEAVFYFVANNAASTGGKHIAAFSGTEAEFVDLRTSALGDGAQPGYAENITIAPGTGGLLMTGKSGPILLKGKCTETVLLKRRTARFDIQNRNLNDNLFIENIFISNAAVQATLFSNSSAAHTIARKGTDVIWGPDPWDYDEQGIAESWFYLYPTDLGATEITIQVRNSDNEYKYYHLDGDIDIDANKRYLLIYKDDSFVVGSGTGDWEDEKI